MSLSWRAPHTETLIAWLLGGLGALCAVVAKWSLDPVEIAYLVYSFLANFVLVAIIFYRR
ncbi:MAG TPA: hypothetical protein VF261_00395 [Candidatus Saccharimonadales bacterium]